LPSKRRRYWFGGEKRRPALWRSSAVYRTAEKSQGHGKKGVHKKRNPQDVPEKIPPQSRIEPKVRRTFGSQSKKEERMLS
jgi:hypothetical protein